MVALKGTNLVLRFLLELCLLAALGYWGFHVAGGRVAKAVLGLGVPVAMMIVWGMFMSPKARVPLPGPVHLGMEVAIFGLGAAALFGAGQLRLAWLFVAAVVLNRVLMTFWGQ
jgi:hypothetical protein